jgi:molybdopterin molybdotransferase
MLSVTAARQQILDALKPVGAETLSLAAARGRVLAEPVIARLTQPPADVSAMDGYALRAADASQGAVLRVIGAAPAGHPVAGAIGPGEAVRLFTGSIVPAGADSVLIQEDATADGDTITVNETCAPAKNIRRAGQDFAVGDTLIPAPKRLTARDIGLAAAGNHPWLTVRRRPRIAILATGDEILLPGDTIPPGSIVSSNAHMLAAFIAEAGGDPTILPIARDDLAAIAAGADAAQGSDLLVTTGGASVGAHDLVQESMRAKGLDLGFWKIAMRPGKPLMFGNIGQLPLLGLPGNPVSAFVCAILFLRPAVDRLLGLPGDAPATEPARLATSLKANDQREDYVRATLTSSHGEWLVTPFPTQDSGMLKTLAHADALIQRPPHDPALQPGTTVRIIRLDRPYPDRHGV